MSPRRFVFPQSGDDLKAITLRELTEIEDAEDRLRSWNLHLATRRSIGVLPSDIVFLEPPHA